MGNVECGVEVFVNVSNDWVFYNGGQSDFTVSFGAGSYNFTRGEFGYLGKPGNSFMENVGYGLGAVVNAVDLVNGVDGVFHFEDKMRARYVKGYGDAVCYDQETIGNNLGFGRRGARPSFPGPDNPRGLNTLGKEVDYYGVLPNGTFLEYPGYIHDVAYAGIGAKGATGLLTNLRAIPADLRFVGQSLYLGTKHLFNTPVLSSQSYLLGAGLGTMAMPKILAIPALFYGIDRMLR